MDQQSENLIDYSETTSASATLQYILPRDFVYLPIVGNKRQSYQRKDNGNGGGLPTDKPKFPCPNCPSVFSHKNNLYYHSKFECGQLPRFNCPYCSYRTKHVSNVRAHVRRKHPGHKVYAIDICKYPNFLLPYDQRHGDYNWTGDNVLPKTTTVTRTGDQHVQRFPCGNCNSVFSRKHNLQYHLKFECGQSPRFNCPYCAYRTRHPSNVRAHDSIVSKKRSQRFFDRGSIVDLRTVRKYSGIDSRQEYSSLQPDYFIQNRERFERYQRQKGGYPCHKCGNHFTWRNNLYNHLKFQCGQLPRFNCPYCSYRTKHASNVRSHIRRIHPHEKVYVVDVYSNYNDQKK
uniref:C2H2-type domain-containing protein n=1 Tax=Vespula pensylvanica TaxID=30213 RepID=A0A834KPT5_VESPE|nr:hypothetical protein H0235_013358 [Vespula pensylvanica]